MAELTLGPPKGESFQIRTASSWLVDCVLGRSGVHFRSAGKSKRKFWFIMLPIERIPYSAIKGRPRLVLPGGARLAVWVIVNVEEWNPSETMPRTVLTPPAGGSPMPDIPNWAWHEYGNRVGFWRMLEVFDRCDVRAALAINGGAIHAYEPIARAALDRG